MGSELIEAALRKELKRSGERWKKFYASMDDAQRQEQLGKLAARRLVSEEMRLRDIEKQKDEACPTPDGLAKVRPGKSGRVIRGTKSL